MTWRISLEAGEQVDGECGGEAEVDGGHMERLKYSWLCPVVTRVAEACSSSVSLMTKYTNV